MGFLDTYETYSDDLPLFRELGLKPFQAKVWEEVSVGRVNLEDGSWVDVSVQGAPAQFWSAEIYSAETERIVKVSTGSGCFSDYWDFFKKIAENMIVIDSIESKMMDGTKISVNARI